jgi:hypothetical protein
MLEFVYDMIHVAMLDKVWLPYLKLLLTHYKTRCNTTSVTAISVVASNGNSNSNGVAIPIAMQFNWQNKIT